MLRDQLKASYIERSKDKKRIAIPLHFHCLNTDNKLINENKFEDKYKVYPSLYYQTEQHIMVNFYKNII